jgi:hypothetical protein
MFLVFFDVGQVGFFKDKEVRKIRITTRENAIVNRLNKTKREEAKPDFKEQREQRDHQEREERKKAYKVLEAENIEEEKRRKEDAQLR